MTNEDCSKKILFLTLEYPPFKGGVARYYENLVNEWGEGITVLKQKLLWALWPKWLRAIWQTARQIKEKKIEMLWIGQVLPLGYVGLWFKHRQNLPFIVFCHGLDILAPQESAWKKKWLTKILHEAQLIVSNSEFTKNEIIKLGIKDDKILIVYPCGYLNKDDLNTEAKDKNKEKIILSVGRLIKRKGFDRVIEILPKILKRFSGVKYVIVGNGPEEAYLKSKITDLKLTEKIIILNNIADEELKTWYNSCDVLVMPYCQIGPDVEGFGMVSLEAANFGKPAIVGNSGGAPETVRNGYGGYIINSEEELYQTLLKLLTDPDFAKRMGEYSQEWVKKRFVWKNEVEKIKQRICQNN